jgi:hypothetical protein
LEKLEEVSRDAGGGGNKPNTIAGRAAMIVVDNKV